MLPLSPARLALLAALASLPLAIPLLWLAGEAHYRSCVEAAEARYPAVSVSAFNTRDTGPLKLSYAVERGRAVQACDHLPL
jgi:hypothetical protein